MQSALERANAELLGRYGVQLANRTGVNTGEVVANDDPTADQKLATNHFTNPVWKPKLHMNYRGERLITNLFTDNVTVQLYDALLQKPSSKQTRAFEINEMHVKWTRSRFQRSSSLAWNRWKARTLTANRIAAGP